MVDKVEIDPNAREGTKLTKGAQLGAIDPQALYALAAVAGFGGAKYDRYNYLRGYQWSSSYDALMRHSMQFWRGENFDVESRLPHMAHVAWHGLTLVSFLLHGLGTDDRPFYVIDKAIKDRTL